MKDKSWIIILIMGIALTISIGYSVFLNQKANEPKESTVITTSIIEMRATTATIKNTLKGNGIIEFKQKEFNNDTSNAIENTENIEENTIVNEKIENENKIPEITLTIEDKDLEKVKAGQEVEITSKLDEKTLNYVGKVKQVNKNLNNKSTLDIEIVNPDENLQEKTPVTCTVIIEKAENVVALPTQAIQKNEENEKYVDVVQPDGSTISVFIKTGISDDYYVEITSGLNVGDRVQIVKSSTTVVNKEEKE